MGDQNDCARGNEKHKQPAHVRLRSRKWTRSSMHSQKPSVWNRYSTAGWCFAATFASARGSIGRMPKGATRRRRRLPGL